MADINMINVEAQVQPVNTMDHISNKIMLLDIKDYQQILPALKQLQINSSKVLKQYHDFLQKQERKTNGLPYMFLKKFEIIRNKLMQINKILTFQNHIYQIAIGNREYEKINEQIFFKTTMKSYEERRLSMKAYILKMESRVQRVEEEVKKNVDYQMHAFTQYQNNLPIDRLENNYQLKLKHKSILYNHLTENRNLRSKINKRIEYLCSKKNINIKEKVKIKSEQKIVTVDNKKMSDSNMRSINQFLYFFMSKQIVLKQYLSKIRQKNRNEKYRLSFAIQKIKDSLKSIEQRNNIINTENRIIQDKYAMVYQQNKVKRKAIRESNSLNKTDYLIFMKQLANAIKILLKENGFAFQYSINNNGQIGVDRRKSKSQKYLIPIQPLTNEEMQIIDKKKKLQFDKFTNIKINEAKMMFKAELTSQSSEKN